MHIAILGTGGVGGYYGAVLARAGHEVRFWARGENLAALHQRGLTVRTPTGEFTLPVQATSSAAGLEGSELALVTVKSYALADVAPLARELAAGGATVLPLLNGIEVNERLVELGVPAGALLGGLTAISAERVVPGVVELRSTFQRVVLGEPDGSRSPRAERVVEAFRSASVDVRLSTEIGVELWQKFIFIASMATTCGLAHSPIGTVRKAPFGPEFIRAAVSEVVAVARTRGIRLPADEIERVIGVIDGLPDGMRPSFLVDLLRGGPSELDALMGTVARLGKALAVPTPTHSAAVAALSPHPG
jgi:2-dehydropantoate 2-reductase